MRRERDSLGDVHVPDDALWGAQTQRAVENFPVSGRRMPTSFLRALAFVKAACAASNDALDPALRTSILAACARIAAGELDAQFPVDVFQTGSGTSTNMNMNEVIARLCPGAHPNDHVNMSQSSNDVIPTAAHVAALVAIRGKLRTSLERLASALEAKARDFDPIVKLGRTHLVDAVPVRLGQEFGGYAAQVRKGLARIDAAARGLEELPIGGTAVGTGLNAPADFGRRVAARLAEETGLPFREAANHFEAQAARDDTVEVAGQVAAIAASLAKIANDIRLLGSGPRAGLGELRLPATQPGSSIMPGKVNPVMSEMLVQVCVYAQGNASMVVACGNAGHFELNAMLPLIAYALHESIRVLAAGARRFADGCAAGIEADEARCRELVDRSLMLVTALNPKLGYDTAASIAKEAYATGRTLREVVLARGLMPEAELDAALDPASMTRPGAKGPGGG
jgi:fumarate hydratase class II